MIHVRVRVQATTRYLSEVLATGSANDISSEKLEDLARNVLLLPSECKIWLTHLLTVVEIAAVVPRRQRPLAKRKKQLLHSVITAANSISKSLMNNKFGLDVTYALVPC